MKNKTLICGSVSLIQVKQEVSDDFVLNLFPKVCTVQSLVTIRQFFAQRSNFSYYVVGNMIAEVKA